MKIEIDLNEIAEDILIEEAFLLSYRVEKDEEGNDLITPDEHIKKHIKNYIRGVVTEYVKKRSTEIAASQLEKFLK